ncbi:hypothetical protein M9434_003436 [Picochlorum sp. BPE23]|nr:hypothetical protein M9434_003436 [Picochlorum sp. BPE23]
MFASSFWPERVVVGVQRPVQATRSCRSLTQYRTPFLPQSARIGSRKFHHGLEDAVYSPSVVSSRRSLNVRARGYNSGSPGVPDRVVGALPYLLPLFDGLRYGKFLFVQFPVLANVIAPLNPLIQLYFSVPFASLAAFFAVYLLIINNYNWPRNVRFNGMQAVLLDIILILPGLLENVLKIRPMGGIGLQIYIQIYNAIFLFIFAAVVYGIVSSMIGQTARIPLVADAADNQVR